MGENDKRLKKEQMIDVITRTALGLEAKFLVLHDSYDKYRENYSPEALELYAEFGDYSDAVHRMMESGQLGRLPSEILKKLLEYSLDVSERLSLGVRMPTNQKKSKGDEIQSDVDGNKNGNLYAYVANNPIKYTDPDGRNDEIQDNIANLGNDIYPLPKLNLYLKEFKQTTFTRDNPLNQLDLDKALGLDTDSKTTVSCQTTAMINAYASSCEGGITGEQIISAVMNKDGSFKNLDIDGSPTNLDGLSRNLAKAIGRDTYKAPSNAKGKPTILADLSNGAILGWAKNGKTRDAHFGYIDWTGTVDSMDPNRPAAKNYTVNTYRILKEKNYRGNK